MKVYIIIQQLIDYEPVISVFSAQEKAKKFKKDFLTKNPHACIIIEEWDVDDETYDGLTVE
jgi:hypothetical protein